MKEDKNKKKKTIRSLDWNEKFNLFLRRNVKALSVFTNAEVKTFIRKLKALKRQYRKEGDNEQVKRISYFLRSL